MPLAGGFFTLKVMGPLLDKLNYDDSYDEHIIVGATILTGVVLALSLRWYLQGRMERSNLVATYKKLEEFIELYANDGPSFVYLKRLYAIAQEEGLTMQERYHALKIEVGRILRELQVQEQI